MATENNPELEWQVWPIGIPWNTKEFVNCYAYDTVVFTHYGLDGIHTPIGSCPECVYNAGTCKCNVGSLIWQPEKSHKCAYVLINKWIGEFASNIWVTESKDFALSFANVTTKIDCENLELLITDQGFAVPKHDYYEMKSLQNFHHFRKKRANEEINNGIVYTPQLAAQFTALSSQMSRTTQRLFSETVKQICQNLQTLADQTLTLAIANPTLLARYFLNVDQISARLITDKLLEIKACHPIQEQEIHFNWKKGFCFNRLPISFNLHGQLKHGFLDTITKIIYPEAKEVSCDIERWMYLNENDKTIQYDQLTGDLKEISDEGIRRIARYGKIDFPEISTTIFKNKAIAAISELYSPEKFSETIEAAVINNEIARLTNPNTFWSVTSQRREIVAGNIVSNGLFAFLRGGILTLNQFWVFTCCCFVTLQFTLQFILPTIFAGTLNYLNVGEAIFNRINTYRERKKIERRSKKENGSELNKNAIPLSQRWPSFNKGEGGETKVKTKIGKDKKEICLLTSTNCDKNSRVMVEINGKKVLCLLDTGAHVSIINQENAKKFGLKDWTIANFPAVYGIGNKLVPTIGQTQVDLKIADCKIKTNFVIIKDGLTKTDSYVAIIGRETLIPVENKLKYNKFEINSGEIEHLSKLIANTKINRSEKEKLKICLNKYCKIFAKNDYDLGKCKIEAPPIITTSETPIQAKPYRTPEKYRDELKIHINNMLKSGVIKESNTPWASNIVLVEKSDGKLRPCVDFRPLNKITISDPYPIPRMEQVIHRVAGKSFYSTLDLASGFWQIPLERKTAQKCGIITEWGLFEMTRLPFGLKNAPSIFQRLMDKILKDLENVTAYIDDILVHSEDFESHIETLNDVFNRLEKAGLKLKAEKCKFLENKCIYLGHELTKEGYKPSLTNSEVIKNFSIPTNVKEVKRFLGLTSFFRKFISNFASIAWPLNDLTRGNERKFEWGEKEENAFIKLKEQLVKSPCLRPPNYELPFHLFCDASSVAYAAALMQSQDGENLYAVGYWSRTLNISEQKLPATHGELAAIYHSIMHFKPIIYGAKLTIHTDHRPLIFLFSKASTSTKLNRWLMAMQEIQPNVVYVEGKANKVADALSRVSANWNDIVNKYPREDIPYLMEIEIGEINRKTIEEETQKDPILEIVYKAIGDNWSEDYSEEIMPYFQIRDKLYINRKIIIKRPNNQIVIPEKLRNGVLKLIHFAHFGVVRSKNKARKIVWWPSINMDIEYFIGECEKCQNNMPNEPQTAFQNKWPEAKIAFERVHIDLAGPVFGKTFLLMVDAYSRYPFIFEMKSTTSIFVINALKEVFSLFGPPSCLVSDNGPQFTSFEFETFLRGCGVNHIKSPPYHPQSNGLCERFVRTFKNSVSKGLDGNNLKDAIPEFLSEYRASPHPSLEGESPSYLFLGRQIKSKIDILKYSPKENLNKPTDEKVENKRESRKRKIFKIDDLIWARNYTGNDKWLKGRVIEDKGDYIYGVEMEDGSVKISHIDQLRSRGNYQLRSRSQSPVETD
uniref:RNA-directed DNA polymerase n=1 Tax=Meloidogyne enterolobii TaxID=390850 RepID=A0A6V7XA71_MELEN|nr:unnamed protein product [Meloidogyne enterolobii]